MAKANLIPGTNKALHLGTRLRAALLASLLLTGTAYAEAAPREFKDSVRIHFRQSKFDIDTLYNGNNDSIDFFRQRLTVLKKENPFAAMRKISVIGSASPEGSIALNKTLSENRANSIFRLFRKLPNLSPSQTEFIFLGRDWKGLKKYVENDPSVPYREEVLTLINSIIEKNRNGEKDGAGNLKALKTLRKGVPYAYLFKNAFAPLRMARICIEWEVIEHLSDTLVAPEALPVNALVMMPQTLEAPDYEEHEVELEKVCKPFFMNLRTNMLFDLAAVPNLGAEFYLGKNWSIGANWMYGWWSKNSAHKYWRIYGGDLNVRKWFGSAANEKPLTGHHLGLFAQVLTYDFEWGGKGYMGGKPGGTIFDRANYGASIEYGYSLPVAERLNIDFSIAAGYLGGKYVTYEPQGAGYVWKSTKQFHWFGPTKAEISLVWQIGCGNRNNKFK
ncbi:MAG: DUF3575 domain-containing protein [Muribaculaceae bacterium]|nr:DUF3575 domain-containing protein [Muribaculaceae bacterium]